jgi:hypothetical protein
MRTKEKKKQVVEIKNRQKVSREDKSTTVQSVHSAADRDLTLWDKCHREEGEKVSSR